MKTILRAFVVLAAITLVPVTGSAQTPKQLFITVVNAGGAPVTDLQPGDFDVREGGLPRKVVRAGLANDPMRIALIVDSSETVGSAALNQFRAGLRNFYDALPLETEVALMTIGRQARMRIAPTTDRKKLNDSASGFFADGGGTAALDGVIEGYSRFLRKVEARWPVMVLVTTDGPITGSVRDDELERLLRDLQAAGVVAHAIVVSTRGSGTPTGIALSVTGSTGGSYEAIAAATALPDKMKFLGEKLAKQFHGASSLYRVEYLSETTGPRGVEVGIARSGVRLTISDKR